jgi:hypothetical protein
LVLPTINRDSPLHNMVLSAVKPIVGPGLKSTRKESRMLQFAPRAVATNQVETNGSANGGRHWPQERKDAGSHAIGPLETADKATSFPGQTRVSRLWSFKFNGTKTRLSRTLQ